MVAAAVVSAAAVAIGPATAAIPAADQVSGLNATYRIV